MGFVGLPKNGSSYDCGLRRRVYWPDTTAPYIQRLMIQSGCPVFFKKREIAHATLFGAQRPG
ncbi:MAG: hypothetical protein ACI9IV_001299 [Paracoccaceae bacterium]|jgi:hypothetical protein